MKRFIKFNVVWAVSLFAAASWSGAVNAESSFVRRQGRHLVVDGKPFYVFGANQHFLFYMPQPVVDEVLEDAAALGLNAIRTWAFCDGQPKDGFCFQPQAGVYDETTFRKLDYVLWKARQLNLRVILPLVNNWDDFGGMKQYVAWCSAAGGHDAFFTNACTKDLYTRYIRSVLTRVNTLTNTAYKDDPTILLWELANEPRAASDPTGAKLGTWVAEMAALIKSIDPNHLVATGEEGWYAGGSDWRHDGSQGADFLRNSQSPSIDVASFHLYPAYYAMNEGEALAWIDEHVRDAHDRLGKPVYLGEFGWRVPRQLLGSFSTGAETWRVDWGYSADSPQRVATPSQDGGGALQYSTPSGGLRAFEMAAGERMLGGAGWDFRPYQFLTGWVYLPPSAPTGMKADVYAKSGPEWIWRDGFEFPLTPGTWTRLDLDVAQLFDPAAVRSVGIRVINGGTPYTGSIAYDTVTALNLFNRETLPDRAGVYESWDQRLDWLDADGALFWQLGAHQPDTALVPDADFYMVYSPEDRETVPVLQAYAQLVAQKNSAGGTIDAPPTVTMQAPAGGAQVTGVVTIRAQVIDDAGVSQVDFAIDNGAARSMVLIGSGVWEGVWDSTAVADGAHTITVRATDSVNQTGGAQVNVTVINTVAQTPVMFVLRIDLGVRRRWFSKEREADAGVCVKSASGSWLRDVRVSASWSGLVTGSAVGTTGSNGCATLFSPRTSASSGTFTLTVANLERSGFRYDPTKNVETSDSVSF